MSTAQIKEVILKQLEVADEKLPRMIYGMAKVYTKPGAEMIIGYDAPGNPKTAAEMKASLKKSDQRAY